MEQEEKTYFGIGEVEKITGIKQHTLRYWEAEFRIIRPARRASGQRKYTKEDIALIAKIKELLYEKGFTVAGAKKTLIEEKKKLRAQTVLEFGKENTAQNVLKKAKRELESILIMLR